jgi:DNA-binding transcriptional MocR family regulator
MLEVAQYQITGATAREIAASAEAAIREGLIDVGQPLPTVRALAEALGTSPATVNSAYRILRERGLVVAEGRRGTRVAPRPALRVPDPVDRLPRRPEVAPPSPDLRDLAVGLPDPALLAPLQPTLARLDPDRDFRLTNPYAPNARLLEVAAKAFAADGLPAAAIAVVGGAFDGIERTLQAHLRPGDRVIVEDPAYPATRDLLLALGLVAVPVTVDDMGLLPEPFELALTRGVEAAVIVPRAQNPLGAALDGSRAAELRSLLERRPDVLVIEDDHVGSVSGAPFSTVIDPARARWAVIRSTSKILHPDLRLAVMAGDATTIARVEGRQAVGTRWVSHVLQATAAALLEDARFETMAAHARDIYTARREALIEALARHGVHAHGRSGLNVWVPVHEEAPVVRALHDAGWLVLSGERFRFSSPPGIRVTTAGLDVDEAPVLAELIAGAEHALRPRRAY